MVNKDQRSVHTVTYPAESHGKFEVVEYDRIIACYILLTSITTTSFLSFLLAIYALYRAHENHTSWYNLEGTEGLPSTGLTPRNFAQSSKFVTVKNCFDIQH